MKGTAVANRKDQPLAEAIGARVLARREELGLAEWQVATLAGVSDGCISLIEIGRSTPCSAIVLPLCRALGMTPNDLFGWSGKRRLRKIK